MMSTESWYAMVSTTNGDLLAVSRYADHLHETIASRWGVDHPEKPSVVECTVPQVTVLKRVKCDACKGCGTVLMADSTEPPGGAEVKP